jgi:hypothetical protein
MKGAFVLGHPDDLSPDAHEVVIEWVKELSEAQRRAAAGEDLDEKVYDMDSEEGQALTTT